MSDRRLRVIERGADAEKGGSDVLALLDQTIRVVLPAGVPAWRHQLLAITLVDLLGRIFPRIAVVVDPEAPADPALPPGPALLVDRLLAARQHGSQPKDPEDPVVTVVIGSAGPGDVYADGAGWQSYVGSKPSRLISRQDGIAIGSLVAACRAASQVFQLVLADQLARDPFRIEEAYSTVLNYGRATDPIDEPELPAPTAIEAVLVGAGSIGGATAYAFAHTPDLSGSLDVVDDDTLKPHNPDRAILATEELSATGAAKSEVVKSALAHHDLLETRSHEERLDAFVAGRARDDALPLVLSAVDSAASRREIQDAIPLDVIDAACSIDQVSVSSHRTADGPCLYCIHVGAVLDSARIKYRLISERTGLPERAVAELHVQNVPLTPQHIAAIEYHRRSHGDMIRPGALDGYIGQTLETLYREQFLYGEALVGMGDGGHAAVAAPFVTAFAGFLLAAEALKAQSAEYQQYRLGSSGPIATMYREDPWRSPLDGLLMNPPRWDGPQCLCRSPLRLRLLHERYGLL